MSDDYEIVSRKELDALKQEVKELKARPTQPPSADLMMALDRLSGHIQHLIKIFEHADKAITEEYHQGVHKDTQKLDLVIAQNEQLAKGLLHMSDLMRKEHKHETHKHYPLQHTDFPEPEPIYKNTHATPKPPIPELPKEQESVPQPHVPKPPEEKPPAPQDLPPPPQITPQDIQKPEETVAVAQPPELPDMPPPPEGAHTPNPEDEQMPSLPPPPDLEQALKHDEIPPVIAPKHSRRSLMRSFK